jgi:prepilin-type N-terminal cleavage/methylation domain-containing protein
MSAECRWRVRSPIGAAASDGIPRPCARRGDAGLSLIEIMMALAVLTVVMVMLFGTYLSAYALSRVNKDKHRALMDTSALLEQMATIPIGDLGNTFPHAADVPAFNDLHVPDQRVQVLYEGGDVTARPLEFQVVSTWTSANRLPARLAIRALRAR